MNPRDMVLCTSMMVVTWGCFLLGSCTKEQTAQTADASLTVAAAICKEVDKQEEPEWVLIACGVVGGAQTIVRMPKRQWFAMKASGVDAGGH